MIIKKLILTVACAATLISAELVAPAPASASGVAAAGAVGFVGGMVSGGALSQSAARPVEVHLVRPYRRHCWVERRRDRWGYVHARRICR